MSFSFDVRSVCPNSFLIAQISAKKVYFQFAECSLSYAKIRNNFQLTFISMR